MNPLRSRCSLPAAFALLAAGAAVFGTPGQGPEFKIHEVAGTVSYIEGAGGNIGVSVGDDGAFVIDTQLANAREGVVGAIEKAAGGKDIRFLLNTHWHGDHTGNNEPFGDRGVAIVAHENVRRRMLGDASLDGNKGDGTPKSAMPALTYATGITLHLNGEDVRVHHFHPGHTDGDSIVFFEESNVLHMGDLFFSGRFPYIDLDSGGDVEGFVEAVGTVIEMFEDDVKIIPGHGPLSTMADLRSHHAMLVETTDRVRKALAAGKTAAQMKAEGLFSDYEDLGWQFITVDRYLDILVRGLRGR